MSQALSIRGYTQTPVLGHVSLGLPPLNLRGLTRAPNLGRVRLGIPGAGDSDISADLMDPTAPATVVAALPLTRGRAWTEQLSEAGSAGITFQNDDPALPGVSESSLIRMSFKGEPAVVMVCDTVDAVELIAPDDEAAEATAWSGRLHITHPERAVVYPSRGVRQKPIQENRAGDYTAPEYDDSGWVNAQGLGTFSAAMAYWYTSTWPGQLFREAFPRFFDFINAANFPDFAAPILSVPGATLRRGRPLPADSGGDTHYRQQVTIPADGSYEAHTIGDDQIEVFGDGVQIATAGSGFLASGSGGVDFTAGVHTIAWHVNSVLDNQVGPGAGVFGPSFDPTFNPMFATWTLVQPAAFGRSQTVIARADSTAKTSGYVTQIPGMTPGRFIRLLFEEAAARGVLVPALGFNDLVDSDGNPWPVVVISTRVGSDYFTVLREMSATYIDFAMRVGTFTLDAWNHGGRGGPRAVALHGPTDPNDSDTETVKRIERKGEQ